MAETESQAAIDEAGATQVDFLYVCDHAFRDSFGRPCIIGIIDVLTVPDFPHFRALLTIAVRLKTPPGARVDIRIQFGLSLADPFREGWFPAQTGSTGYLFIPFHMPQLRFDVPGDYFVSVMDDSDDNRILATRRVTVVGASQTHPS